MRARLATHESIWLWVALIASAVISGGCGIEETYTGMGDGAIPGDPLKPIPQRPGLRPQGT